MKFIEHFFESFLWNTRFFVLLAVIFSMLGGIALFVVASVDIFSMVSQVAMSYIGHAEHGADFHGSIVSMLIGAVDLYLIAIVMFIFGFGLYELFISEIDVAQRSASSKILEIHSLDELKDKLGKVIVMVLVVNFFQQVIDKSISGIDMVYFAISILGLSVALYFLHKGGDH